MSANKVFLLGNLGKDPELHTGSKTWCKFSLATNDGWGDNKVTNWHQCVAFGNKAQAIANYVKGGDSLCVQGWVKYKEYEGKWSTTIMVEEFSFVGRSPQQRDPQDQRTEHDEELPF